MCCEAARQRNAADSFLYKVMSRLQYRVEPARRRNHSKTDYSFKTKILLKINNNNNKKRKPTTQPTSKPRARACNKGGVVDSTGLQ